MANNCWYEMRVVSKSKSSLERFISIMNYADPEYYIYRVFLAEPDEIKEHDGFFHVNIAGDVAWSCYRWFSDKEDTENVLNSENNKTAHYVSIPILCQRLCLGVEVFSQEIGLGFEEHYLVDHSGEILADDCIDIGGGGRENSAFAGKGGFPKYGSYEEVEKIYG